MSARVLLLISAQCATADLATGDAPCRDYQRLQQRLHADVIDYGSLDQCWWTRALRRFVGVPVLQALVAFLRARDYDVLYSDGEHIGIPLALMLRLRRHRPSHISIGHLLDTRLKRAVFRIFKPQNAIDRILVHSVAQRRFAIDRLGFAPQAAVLVPYQADAEFWQPADAPNGTPCLCAAGLEYRDYATLVRAVEDLDVKLTIAAGSHWSKHRDRAQARPLPENVEVTGLLDYTSLRQLYAKSLMVVIPLFQAPNQAGVTTVLEAMAMGKPVIVTATEGQRDVVHGRLCTQSGLSADPIGGPFAFGVAESATGDETGVYVPVEDPAALRSAIAVTCSITRRLHSAWVRRAGD